jgi:pimeloyl-ACP methyl ester carboxylesterase
MQTVTGQTPSGLGWKRLGEGPTVVVLHGGPGLSHHYLLPQFGALAEGLELLLYDQRLAGTPTWRDHVADLESLRSELGLGALRLCGYSWGGLLALLYALEHPGRVERLALCSPAPPVHGYRDEMQAIMRERLGRADALGLSGFARAVAGYFADPRRARELTPFRVQTRAESSVHASLGDYDLRPRLGEIRCPVLALHGTADPIPIRYTEELVRLLPDARLVRLEGCGHVPYIECPEPFFKALRAFLQGNMWH